MITKLYQDVTTISVAIEKGLGFKCYLSILVDDSPVLRVRTPLDEVYRVHLTGEVTNDIGGKESTREDIESILNNLA